MTYKLPLIIECVPEAVHVKSMLSPATTAQASNTCPGQTESSSVATSTDWETVGCQCEATIAITWDLESSGEGGEVRWNSGRIWKAESSPSSGSELSVEYGDCETGQSTLNTVTVRHRCSNNDPWTTDTDSRNCVEC